ncbi:MAG TPA: hypothetical protein VGM20_04805 [Gemmatimonadales bacterium]
MALEIFTGDHLPAILTRIRAALGPEACVVQLRRRGAEFELIASDGTGAYAPAPAVAATAPRDLAPTAPRDLPKVAPRSEWARPVEMQPEEVPDFRNALDAHFAAPAARPAPVATVRAPEAKRDAETNAALPKRASFMVRPWVVALVGPTGAGKTTTIAKLATNRLGFGGCRVGLMGLDTYRVGAVEQLETYADLADLPIEIVYSDAEAKRALARLNDCEVVLVDTPGRGPRNTGDTETIRRWLAELAPDEVHLTVPAGQLPAVTRRILRAYAPFNITHLLATKLDEHPGEQAAFDIAIENSRGMRWMTDGQEVPADLHAAADALARAATRRDAGVLLESCA